MNFLETRQDQHLRHRDVEKGKETRIPNKDFANQEGNTNTNIERYQENREHLALLCPPPFFTIIHLTFVLGKVNINLL